MTAALEVEAPDVLVRFRRVEVLGFGWADEPGQVVGVLQRRTPGEVLVRSSGLLLRFMVEDIDELLWHASVGPGVVPL